MIAAMPRKWLRFSHCVRDGDAIQQLPGGAKAQEAMLKQTVASLDVTLQIAPDDAELNVLVASALGRLAQIQGNPTFAGPERGAEARATVARALSLAGKVWAHKQADVRFVTQHLICRAISRLSTRVPSLPTAALPKRCRSWTWRCSAPPRWRGTAARRLRRSGWLGCKSARPPASTRYATRRKPWRCCSRRWTRCTVSRRMRRNRQSCATRQRRARH